MAEGTMSPPRGTDQGLIAPVVPLRRRATDGTTREPAPPLQASIATLDRADEPMACVEHPDIWEHPAPCLPARQPPAPPTDARERQREGAKRPGIVRHPRVVAVMATCAGVVALSAVAVAVSAQHRTGAVAIGHAAATHQETRVQTVKARPAELHANGDRATSTKPTTRSRHRQRPVLTLRQNPPAPVASVASDEPETSTASPAARQIAPATDARSAPTGAITTSQASEPPPAAAPSSQTAGSPGGCATAVPGQLGC